MIKYNFRYRGPYEYDKFILNYFQFHNEVMNLLKELDETDYNSLVSIYSQIDEMLNDSLDLSHEIHKIALKKVVNS